MLWIVAYASEQVARIDLRTLSTSWFPVGAGLVFVVPDGAGAWVGSEVAGRISYVSPDPPGLRDPLMVDGIPDTAVLSQGRLLVWSSQGGGPSRGIITVFDAETGAVTGVAPARTVAGDPVKVAGAVWVIVRDGAERIDPASGVATARLDSGATTIHQDLPNDGMSITRTGTWRHLAVGGNTAWTVRIDHGHPGTLIASDLIAGTSRPVPIEIDMAGFPPAPPRPRRRRPYHDVPRPSSPSEYERLVVAALDQERRATPGWRSRRTGRTLRDPLGDCHHEAVRLSASYADTRVQLIFTTTDLPGVLLGWETRLWEDDGRAVWDNIENITGRPGGDGRLPLAGPSAEEIDLECRGDTHGAHWGPPDGPEPDAEGITWITDPYSGHDSFADEMERIRRAYHPLGRPFPRSEIDALTTGGIDSVDALAAHVTLRWTDPGARPGRWLLGELGGPDLLPGLVQQLGHHPDAGIRAETTAVAARIAWRHQIAPDPFIDAFAHEADPVVRAALLAAATEPHSTAGYQLAMRVLTDPSEASPARQEAAHATGRLGYGRPTSVTLLTATLADPDADVAAAAGHALARATRRATTHLAPHLDDARPTSRDDTVGQRIRRALARAADDRDDE